MRRKKGDTSFYNEKRDIIHNNEKIIKDTFRAKRKTSNTGG